MPDIVPYAVATLAGYLAICPWGGRRPCPDPPKSFLGLVLGAFAAVGYDVLFLGKRSFESNDIFPVALTAFLFAYFISSLIFPRRGA